MIDDRHIKKTLWTVASIIRPRSAWVARKLSCTDSWSTAWARVEVSNLVASVVATDDIEVVDKTSTKW